MLVANFLIFFAEVAFVLMASVWAKNNLTALSVALISVVAPLIVYMVVPGSLGEWLSTLLPAGGIGLSNALLYKMYSFDFLFAGGHAFFQADVLRALAPVKIVLFLALAVWGYRRKMVRPAILPHLLTKIRDATIPKTKERHWLLMWSAPYRHYVKRLTAWVWETEAVNLFCFWNNVLLSQSLWACPERHPLRSSR